MFIIFIGQELTLDYFENKLDVDHELLIQFRGGQSDMKCGDASPVSGCAPDTNTWSWLAITNIYGEVHRIGYKVTRQSGSPNFSSAFHHT